MRMAGESLAARKRRAGRIGRALQRAYPDAVCALHYDTPFQLLVATILSAQCTDEKVNEVTAVLFRQYGSARALADADPTVRCRAVLALGELADRYIVPSLRRALADDVVFVRAAAVRALGEVGDPLSLADVLRALGDETEDLNGAVTAAALISAAKLGGPEGLAKALSLAGDRVERLWFLRATVARAIELADDRGRSGVLERLLESDPDPRVVQAAARALGVFGLVESLEAAGKSEEAFRRKAVAAGLAVSTSPKAEEVLVAMVNDPNPGVVLEAADALAGRGKAEALPVLFRLLEVDSAVWTGAERDNPVWMGALASLRRRTGLDYGRDPPRFRRWYETNREHLVFDRDRGMFRVER